MISEFSISEKVLSATVVGEPPPPVVGFGFKPFLNFITEDDVSQETFMTDADVATLQSLTGVQT